MLTVRDIVEDMQPTSARSENSANFVVEDSVVEDKEKD